MAAPERSRRSSHRRHDSARLRIDAARAYLRPGERSLQPVACTVRASGDGKRA